MRCSPTIPIPAPGDGNALKLPRSRFGLPWLNSPTLGFRVTVDQLSVPSRPPFLLRQSVIKSSLDEVVSIGSESTISWRSRHSLGTPPENRTAYDAISAISLDCRIALLSVPLAILRLVASTETSVKRATMSDVAAASTMAIRSAEPFLFHRPWCDGALSIMAVVFTVKKSDANRTS